ncbi:hypothetical protein ACOMHN_042209 [Nucella lapillus]
MSLLPHVFHRTVVRHLLFSPNTMFRLSSPQKLLVALLAMLLLCPPGVVQGFGVCRSSFRCFNGGVERYGTSIFSPCRCQCPSGYTGPRCQYREAYGKRSTSLTAITQFLQASLQQEGRQEEERDVFTDNHNDDDNVDDDYYDGDYDASFLALPREGERERWGRLHPKFFRR